MGLELSTGVFFVNDGYKTTKLGDGIPFIEDIENCSTNENPSHSYSLYNLPSASFEVTGVDLALLNDFCSISKPNKIFIMEYSMPIMIQARWHKNSRIRKKWLKRFGMKPDTVKVRTNATVGEYHTDDGTFDFETDKLEYIWRLDQKRKDLKIDLKGMI